jgi:hypothetical protein
MVYTVAADHQHCPLPTWIEHPSHEQHSASLDIANGEQERPIETHDERRLGEPERERLGRAVRAIAASMALKSLPSSPIHPL